MDHARAHSLGLLYAAVANLAESVTPGEFARDVGIAVTFNVESPFGRAVRALLDRWTTSDIEWIARIIAEDMAA